MAFVSPGVCLVKSGVFPVKLQDFIYIGLMLTPQIHPIPLHCNTGLQVHCTLQCTRLEMPIQDRGGNIINFLPRCGKLYYSFDS